MTDSPTKATVDSRGARGGAPDAHPMTPAGRPGSPDPGPRRDRRRSTAAACAGLFATLVTVWALTGPTPGEALSGVVPRPPLPSDTPAGAGHDNGPPPRSLGAAELAALPEATTFTVLRDAPRDPAPQQPPSGHVVHPTTEHPVYAAPGGAAIARLPPRQLGSDTWLPVVAEQPGWVQVLLPTRPNHTTGWLHQTTALREADSPYLLRVNLARFELELLHHGTRIGRWTVGIGKSSAPTPTGRTFLLASLRDTTPSFSEIVLPLGAHSDTHLSYGGGPGTVAIHGWPTTDAFGAATSDGCLRVPDTALDLISTRVPLGTPVLIT